MTNHIEIKIAKVEDFEYNPEGGALIPKVKRGQLLPIFAVF